MEPMYDSNLFLRIPKRAHRLGQRKEVWCYPIRTNTAIEDMVEARRKKKSALREYASNLASLLQERRRCQDYYTEY